MDAVFWTRTSSGTQSAAAATEAEREATTAEIIAGMSDDELALALKLKEHFDPLLYSIGDMPEGTIVTDPYFSDVLVPVELAR